MLIPVPFLFAEKGAERMEEEVNQRVVSLSVNTSKMTAGVLVNTMKNFLVREHQALNQHAAERQAERKAHEHGKMTLKDLMAQNAGAESVVISDDNIKSFDRVARKYNIDYSLKRDKTQDPPKYLLFFKARDRDTMMTAFREYVQKNEQYKQKHPMKQKLKEYEEMRKRLNKQRFKEKHKHQERSL